MNKRTTICLHMQKQLFRILHFLPLTITVFAHCQAPNRHNSETLFPTYNGLVMAGYQGWFRAAGDGSTSKRYAYGDENQSSIDLWPDVSEYQKTYETPFICRMGQRRAFSVRSINLPSTCILSGCRSMVSMVYLCSVFLMIPEKTGAIKNLRLYCKMRSKPLRNIKERLP